MSFCRGWLVHHPQHCWTTGFEETPHQYRRQAQEYDVEPSRVIPGDLRLRSSKAGRMRSIRLIVRHQRPKSISRE